MIFVICVFVITIFITVLYSFTNDSDSNFLNIEGWSISDDPQIENSGSGGDGLSHADPDPNPDPDQEDSSESNFTSEEKNLLSHLSTYVDLEIVLETIEISSSQRDSFSLGIINQIIKLEKVFGYSLSERPVLVLTDDPGYILDKYNFDITKLFYR